LSKKNLKANHNYAIGESAEIYVVLNLVKEKSESKSQPLSCRLSEETVVCNLVKEKIESKSQQDV
jgi:hypothetical protein